VLEISLGSGLKLIL